MNVLIPMAGNGSRFNTDTPKHMIDILGKPMVVRMIESMNLDARWFFVLRSGQMVEETKEAIRSTGVDCLFHEIENLTEGPAATALTMQPYIDNWQELIIANCDQIMEWDSQAFLHNARLYDGCLVTYHSDTEKNSYCEVESGRVVRVREKEVISNISSNGIHYWKEGRDFVRSAYQMIGEDVRAPNGEFYIAPTYNYLLDKNIGIYHIPNQYHHAVGVPLDLEKYIVYAQSKTR